MESSSVFDAFVADVGVEEAGVGIQRFGGREVSARAGEKWLERGQVEREAAVDDVVGGAVERDDAEEFAGADVMPVQQGEQGTVIAMLHVAQHAADEAHVGKLRQRASCCRRLRTSRSAFRCRA